MRMTLLAALLSVAISPSMTRAAEQGAAMGSKPGEASCGQMVSNGAVVPQKMADFTSAAANLLEAHATFMSQDKDKAAQTEIKGLRELAKNNKQAATSLEKVTTDMKKAASWPAAPHDMAKIKADPQLAAAQKKFLDTSHELINALQKMNADMEKAMAQK